MVGKLFHLLIAFVFPAIIFLVVPATPAAAGEQEKAVSDIDDLTLEDLLNVEITTAGKKSETIADIPASVVIVTRPEIEKYGYQSVEEVLENIPGYYKIDESFWYTTTSFGVRGFFSGQYVDNIVVMVNNIPQDEYAADSYLLNIPVEAIDRIEVVRGPLSVIYGNGAFFGAINIVTNEIPKSGPTNQVSFSIGSNKEKRINLRFSGQSGDFKYVGNANIADTDGIDRPFSHMMSNPGLLPAFGLTPDASTAGKLSGNTRYFDLFTSYKNFRFSLNHTKIHKGVIVLFPTPGNGSYAKMNISRVHIGYNKKISGTFTLDLSFNYNETKLFDNYAFFHENMYSPNLASANGYKLEADAFLEPSDTFKMTVGVSFESSLDYHNSADAPEIGLADFTVIMKPGDSIDTFAGFTQVDWTPSGKLKFTVGARFEKPAPYSLRNIIAAGVSLSNPANVVVIDREYDETDLIFIPRVAAVFSFNKKNILKLMYGKAIKRPSPARNNEQFFWSGSHDLPNLTEAKIETFELNYILAPSAKFFASLGVFHNKMNYLFTLSYLTDASGTLLLASSNKGKMTTTGVEITLKTVPFENFHLEGSLMYQKSDNKQAEFDGIAPGYSPNFLGYIRGYYDIPGGPSIGFTGRYVDKMQAGWNIGEASRYGAETDGYFLVGLNLRWENIFKHGFININAANVFDRDVMYPPTSTNTGWADLGIVGAGRTLLITLGWKF